MARKKVNDLDNTVKLTEEDLKHIRGGVIATSGLEQKVLGDGSVKTHNWQPITLKRGYVTTVTLLD